jgi:hypothetical protein
MLTVRITIFFFAFALSISNASAQFIHSSVAAHKSAAKQDFPKTESVLTSLPFSVVQSGPSTVQLSSDGEYTFECTVRNVSSVADSIYFKRSELLPVGWTTSVCWGTNCFADAVDSVIYVIPPLGTASLSLNVFPCLNNTPDSTTVSLRVGVLGSSSDTMLLPFQVSFVPANPPLVFQWSGVSYPGPSFDTNFVGNGNHILSNFLENDFGLGAEYKFSIQDSLPAGWMLTTCVQGLQNNCTSGDSLKVAFEPFGSDNYQQLLKFTLNVPEITTTDSAIIYFAVHPEISNPADSATYRFSMVVESTNSGVASQSGGQAGMAITNAWPNPLHPASMLHLEVMTDKDGPVTAGIYDLDGTPKGTLELGSLSVGSNELQATVPDLASGEYIIRIQQGTDAPEIVRINYIK